MEFKSEPFDQEFTFDLEIDMDQILEDSAASENPMFLKSNSRVLGRHDLQSWE